MENDHKDKERLEGEGVGRSRSFEVIMMLAGGVIVIAGLKAGRELLMPILLAFFLAVLSLPITISLREKFRLPKVLAVLLTMVINLAIVGGVFYLGITLMEDFQSDVRGYFNRFYTKMVETSAAMEDVPLLKMLSERVPFLNFENIKLEEELLRFVKEDALGAVVSQTQFLLGRVTSLLTKTFIVFLLMIFMLIEAGGFQRKMGEIFRAKGPDFNRFKRVGLDIQRYLTLKTLVGALTGVLAGLLCWMAEVDFYILWGLVAFVMNYIPTIGSILAAIPAIFIALVQYDFWHALVILLGYMGINVLLGNFVEPVLLGKRFGLSILVVFLSVLVWGWIWGPIGMFLSIPLTMVLKVALDNTEDLRWLSLAIGKDKKKPALTLARVTGKKPTEK